MAAEVGYAHPESRPRPATLPLAPFDWVIVFVVGVLMIIGAAMVYSASVTVSSGTPDWRVWWNTPLRQGVFATIGFVVMLMAAHVDVRSLGWRSRWGGWPAVLVILTAGLLIAVLVPGIGRHVLGARRAIALPGVPVGFQPSELAKVTLVIWLAAWLTRTATAPRGDRRRYPVLGTGHAEAPIRPGDIRDFRTGFVPAVLVAGMLAGLTGLEDFGTAALLGTVMLVMLYVGGARLAHLGMLGLLGVAAGAALVLLRPHRVARIATWWSENPDPHGAGYQIHQAMLAIGSGGWWGRGLGAGVQKYGYLPQDNNDFILAIVCEELGVAGGLLVAVLFLLLLLRGMWIARNADSGFTRLLALGLTLIVCLQAAFNIGVVTNSVPTKGISLPFVSAGGSGVVFLGLGMGLLAAAGFRRERAAPR
jgi:cell division protein FtsW